MPALALKTAAAGLIRSDEVAFDRHARLIDEDAVRTTSGDDVARAVQAPPGVVPAVPPMTMPGDRRDGIRGVSRPGRAVRQRANAVALDASACRARGDDHRDAGATVAGDDVARAESRATDDIVGRAFDADAVTAVCDL